MSRTPARPRPAPVDRGIPVELRSLLLLGAVTAAVSLGAVAAFVGPWSPHALHRPAGLVAAGAPAAARDAWLALADHRLAGASNRAAALWRAAQVTAVELNDPAAADALALRLIGEHPESADVPEALALRGVLAQRLGRPADAVTHLVAAADALGDGPRAGALLLSAAQLDPAQSGLSPAEREALLQRAAGEPTAAARAWIELGNLSLEASPAAAYEAYARALQAAGAADGAESDAARTARLGMATALERLEGREAALAAVDEGLAEDADDEAMKRRKKRLDKRRR
jgi:hypothetical protein